MATDVLDGQMTIFDFLDDEQAYIMAIPPSDIVLSSECDTEEWLENHRSYWYMHVEAIYKALPRLASWIKAVKLLEKHRNDKTTVKMCAKTMRDRGR